MSEPDTKERARAAAKKRARAAAKRKCFYQLPHGVLIIIPYLPIFHAGFTVPGYITLPQGTTVWVEFYGEPGTPLEEANVDQTEQEPLP